MRVSVAYTLTSIAGLAIYTLFLKIETREVSSKTKSLNYSIHDCYEESPQEGPLLLKQIWPLQYSILEFKIEINYIWGLPEICKDTFQRIFSQGSLTILLCELCIL